MFNPFFLFLNNILIGTVFFSPDYAYGHPGGFSPFILNPGWLDAAYMSYALPDYFRQQQQGYHPNLSKGKNFN